MQIEVSRFPAHAQNDETVVYKICPSRSSQVLIEHFGEEHSGGTLNVDRYSAYKAIAKTSAFILAFCWAHVWRDFLIKKTIRRLRRRGGLRYSLALTANHALQRSK